MKKTVVLINMILIGFLSVVSAQTTKNKIIIAEGSGSFLQMGGVGHKKDTIKVFYHRPENFDSNSKILFVIPGAGRNGDSYRDSWVVISEKHSVLIISPSYAEKDYPYGDYHLGGVVENLNMMAGVSFRKNSNIVDLDESKVKYKLDLSKKNWIYSDFDRLFETIKKVTNSTQKKYDIFGHSAGGQILHRFIIFNPNSKADRILASNAGSYTLPDFETNFPFGIKDVGLKQKDIKKSLNKKLTLFLGELDNENETGGLLLRSPTADKQGTHRLERGKFFYNFGKDLSEKMNLKCQWKLEVISGVGHNQRKMAKAAGAYLYE